MKKTEGSSPTIQVLERMFSLLDVLAAHQDPVSLKEISEQTGLHPSTAHRILNDLAIGRFVDRPEAGPGRLLFFDPIHFVMERKMMLGIRKRAEA